MKTFFRTHAPALDAVLIVLGAIAAAMLVASFTWNVEAMASGAPWQLVGWQPRACPGCAVCGLSRAFAAVSHGRWSDALHFNASVLALYPAACFVALLGATAAVRSLRPRRA